MSNTDFSFDRFRVHKDDGLYSAVCGEGFHGILREAVHTRGLFGEESFMAAGAVRALKGAAAGVFGVAPEHIALEFYDENYSVVFLDARTGATPRGGYVFFAYLNVEREGSIYMRVAPRKGALCHIETPQHGGVVGL